MHFAERAPLHRIGSRIWTFEARKITTIPLASFVLFEEDTLTFFAQEPSAAPAMTLLSCSQTCTDPTDCVVITGHSQGGASAAVASILAYDLIRLYLPLVCLLPLDFYAYSIGALVSFCQPSQRGERSRRPWL